MPAGGLDGVHLRKSNSRRIKPLLLLMSFDASRMFAGGWVSGAQKRLTAEAKGVARTITQRE